MKQDIEIKQNIILNTQNSLGLCDNDLDKLVSYILSERKEAQKELLIKLNDDSCCPEELGELVQNWMKLNL